MRRLISVLAFGIALLGASSPQPAAPQRDISGQWQGTLESGWGLRIILKITKGANGTWNATQYNRDNDSWNSITYKVDRTPKSLPVNSLTLRGSDLKFSVNAVHGSYEGTLSPDGRSVTGMWTQGKSFPLDFQRATRKTAWSTASTNVSTARTAKDPSPKFFNGVGSSAFSYNVMSGISIAIVHRGHIVYEKGFGTTIPAHYTVTADTPFEIGSITKQFTAAAIMLLARQHKLSLDDTLATYVPSLPNAAHITLRMMLNQTSGLHNYPVFTEYHPWPTQENIALSQIIAILATNKPDFAPGTRWEYSNTNYTALAAVIEKVTGMPYGTVLHDLIFAPLHMTDSGYGHAAQNRLNAGSYPSEKVGYPLQSADFYSGAGGIYSSARDMARWDIALMRGTLLSKSEVATVWETGKLNDGEPVHYGMGWVPDQFVGHRLFWHNGLAAIGGYCYNAIFPDDDLAVVILNNGLGAQGVPERMLREIAAKYGIGTPPPPVTAPPVAAGDDPAIDALARSFWDHLSAGTIDSADLTPQFAASWTPARLAETQVSNAVLGAVRFFTFSGTTTTKSITLYHYTLTYTSGLERLWAIQVTPDHKISSSEPVQ